MNAHLSFRKPVFRTAASAIFALGLALCCAAERPHFQPQAAPPHMTSPGGFNRRGDTQRFGGQNGGLQQNGGARGQHLQQWMQMHQSLTPQQRQKALEREPGFSQLPLPTQQRMIQRLNHLDNMPAEQRERVIQRGEAMQRLNPQERLQVRSAMGQLGALSEDRRRAVARSFRELRSMTTVQRNQLLNSPQYRQQFSDEERGTLGNLLSVSPLLPQSR